MKSIYLRSLLLVAFFFSFESHAQDAERETMSPEDRAMKLTAWMKNNLQLTDEQEKSVHEINLKYAGKTEELRNSSEPKGQKFKKLKSYNDDKDNELKGLLTAEQFKTYQAKKEEVKEEFKAKAKEKKKDQQ